VIDPPWPGPGETWTPKGPKYKNLVSIQPYSSLTGVQIATMRIPALAHTAGQLFLWAPTRQVGDAFLLLSTWGFKYRGLFVWLKPLGMGRHIRHQVEFLLWGGRPGAKLMVPKEVPVQVHQWPKPRRHSEKPAEAYALIRRLTDPPRIDLFARQHRPGFHPWGNEVGKLDP